MHSISAPTPWYRRLIERLGPEQRRIIKFALVGGSGVGVNLVVASLFKHFGAAATVAFFAGIVVSIFTNFVLNDAWTWADRGERGLGPWLRRCAKYYLTNGVAAALQFGVAMLAYSLWLDALRPVFGIDGQTVGTGLASFIGIVIATPLNYIINNLWTFRDRSD